MRDSCFHPFLTVRVQRSPHPEEPVTETVPLTVLADHVATLKAALAKAESELEIQRPERERAERLAATVPVLREALSELKAERLGF